MTQPIPANSSCYFYVDVERAFHPLKQSPFTFTGITVAFYYLFIFNGSILRFPLSKEWYNLPEAVTVRLVLVSVPPSWHLLNASSAFSVLGHHSTEVLDLFESTSPLAWELHFAGWLCNPQFTWCSFCRGMWWDGWRKLIIMVFCLGLFSSCFREFLNPILNPIKI